MQVSALAVSVRGISHFWCHKSTFTSPVTAVENYFWPRKTSPGLFFFIWWRDENYRWEGTELEMRCGGKSDGEERGRGMVPQLTETGAK